MAVAVWGGHFYWSSPPRRGQMANMRRLQFSLRTLLVAAMVLPPAGYWILRSKQRANAAHDYQAAASSYDVGTATFGQVYDCSRRLRDAELALPFSNRRKTMIGYLNRLAYMDERLNARLLFSTSGESYFKELEARLAAIRVERKALEEELGVTGNPALGGALGTLDAEVPNTDPE